MNLPFLAARFHTTVQNKTAEGGTVAMYHLANPETAETYMSLGVPPERHDWARDIADRCNYFDVMRKTLQMCDALLAARPESREAMRGDVAATVKEVLDKVHAI